MVEESVLNLIQNYLALLNQEGIHASQAILFGSHAQGLARVYRRFELSA